MKCLLAALAALTLILVGCSEGSGDGSGKPVIVTSTNVWGSVASAVAGDKAQVTVLFSGGTDPHEFEPTAADTATVIDADIVVVNGGGYDQAVADAAGNSSAKGTEINAYDLLTGDEHGHGDHHHGTTNEHVFYDLTVVEQVADKIASELSSKDAVNADTYRANAAAFSKQIQTLRDKLATIKSAHNGTKVAQTEPLAGYLLDEAGLVDAAPAGFTQAVEEGQSPSGADRAALQDLLQNRTVRALVYNTQAVDPVTEAMLKVAAQSNVPVVRFTETLPDGVDTYFAWQSGQIDALSTALSTGR